MNAVTDVDRAITRYCMMLTERGTGADCERVQFEADPRGKKYTRIWRVHRPLDSDEVIMRSAHSFVERSTGKIYKPDGYKRPALNFPRGSVYDDDLSGFDQIRTL